MFISDMSFVAAHRGTGFRARHLLARDQPGKLRGFQYEQRALPRVRRRAHAARPDRAYHRSLPECTRFELLRSDGDFLYDHLPAGRVFGRPS